MSRKVCAALWLSVYLRFVRCIYFAWGLCVHLYRTRLPHCRALYVTHHKQVKREEFYWLYTVELTAFESGETCRTVWLQHGMQTASTGRGELSRGESCSLGSVVMKMFIALLPSN